MPEEGSLYLVSEFMADGQLNMFLSSDNEAYASLSVMDLIGLVIDIVQAVGHIHDHDYVLRTRVSTKDVLLTHYTDAKGQLRYKAKVGAIKQKYTLYMIAARGLII